LQGLFGFHLLGRGAEGSGEDGLDGYAYGEGAPAYFGYPGPDLERWIDEHLATPQVLLMGRVTYEAMSAIVRDQPVEGRDRMNELPKVVFSGTLGEPLEWNNSRLAKGDLVEEVRSLKAVPDLFDQVFESARSANGERV
jgi:dihydrofolate reductase